MYIHIHTIHIFIINYIYFENIGIHIHINTIIYIYTHNYTRNAWALPHRCGVEGSQFQSNVVATLHSPGKINKGIRDYLNPTPLNSASIGKINKGIREY